MKKIYITMLNILSIPIALLGGIFLACTRNRSKASGFYHSDGHPRDDGTGFTFQQLYGSPNPLWRPIGKDAVYRTLAYLKEKDIHYVAPSAHDTCDWSLQAFGDEYHPVKVGDRLRIKETTYAQQISQ